MMLLLAALALGAPPVASTGTPGGPSGFGVGVVFGEPTALSFAWRAGGRTALDAAVGWSFPREWLAVHGDILYTLAVLDAPELPGVHFPFYVGVGPRLRVDLGGGDDTDLGVRVPLGMGIYSDGTPVEGFLEIVPGVGIIPSTKGFLDAGVGVRYYF